MTVTEDLQGDGEEVLEIMIELHQGSNDGTSICSTSNDYLLVEWPISKLSLEENDEFVIRGWVEDFAVLASQDKSFVLRRAETSNSLVLLQQESSSTASVQAILHDCIECIPNDSSKYLCRLNNLLKTRPPFSGVGNLSAEVLECPLTMDELLDAIPASECEILDALRLMEVIQYEQRSADSINACLFLMDLDYAFTFFQYLMTLSTLNESNILQESVSIDGQIQKWMNSDDIGDEASDWNTEYPFYIVRQILSYYNAIKDAESDSFQLDARKLIRLCIKSQLVKRNVWRLDELFQQVQSAMSESFDLGEELTNELDFISYLSGLALVSPARQGFDENQFIVSRLDESTLEWDFKVRLSKLFNEKHEWTLSELLPYFEKLMGRIESNSSPEKKLAISLISFCNSRKDTVSQEVLYSLKATFKAHLK